jgi:hypothetical protein
MPDQINSDTSMARSPSPKPSPPPKARAAQTRDSQAPSGRHVRASDLRALSHLGRQATTGTTDIVEAVHQSVWRTLGVPGGAAPDRTRGLTSLVYRCIHGITQAVGTGLDAALGRLQPLLEALEGVPEESAPRVAVLSALNGVMGDRLAADANPLAIHMQVRCNGQRLDPDAPRPDPVAGGKLLLLVHGLCMNDLQWQTWCKTGDGELAPGLDHGQTQAAVHGYQPLYLRYNTGRHISDNGEQLADLLERVIAAWPQPVQELSCIGHSMGGLVLRSAVASAQARGMRWPAQLRKLIFLGSPHHGAPLEQAGRWVDQLLGQTPYAAPFARLTRLRSCGITDLRHGSVSAADWQGRDRHRSGQDPRAPVPLPVGVACFTVAATAVAQRSALAERLIGDGLVPLRSALGQHADPAMTLAFSAGHTCTRYRTGHLQLLGDAAVARQISDWLAAAPVAGS